ncbi:MAG: hypothetical protein ACI9HE_003735, partial [Planctomycetota bacterium]
SQGFPQGVSIVEVGHGRSLRFKGIPSEPQFLGRVKYDDESFPRSNARSNA